MPVISEKKYLVLKNEIIDYIKRNKLKQNDKLPTVQELIKNYSVSYATVNRTLIELENEGVITKHQGKGLYVNYSGAERTKCVGLIIPSPVSEYKIFMNILNGIKSVLEKSNINLLISISNMSHQLESENISQMVSRQIDGLIIFLEDYYRKNYDHVANLKKNNFPFVLIDRYIPELDTDYVIVNNKDALYGICSYLKYKKKCEKIFFVPDHSTSKETTATEEKIAGYTKAMNILYGKEQAAVLEMNDLLERVNEFSSACANFGVSFNHDGLALEFIKALKDRNTEIPSNCHIFGYNNSHEPLLFPTVEQFNDEVGKRAARLLIERIANPLIETRKIKIDARLILPDETMPEA
jgi:GntR family transcriptional regulator, arabinose operon transcriptional repressor